MDIKKCVIPAAGLETRFLPLSKAVPKTLLPLADLPLIHYIVQEAVESGISEIVFVLSENKKAVAEYFKKNQKLEEALRKNRKNTNGAKGLQVLRNMEKGLEGINFSTCFQSEPRGDGDAIMKAKNYLKTSAFSVLFSDDVFYSKVPALAQLKKIFLTAQKPVVGLVKKDKKEIPGYGVVRAEKIANRLYKIKGIVEKPKAEEAPSDLALCGRYILTPEIFNFLKQTKKDEKGEIILAKALEQMLADGRVIYGYELDAEWLECGNKIGWMKSNLKMMMGHPEYGGALKEFLKKNF